MNRTRMLVVAAYATLGLAIVAPSWLSYADEQGRAVPRESGQKATPRQAPARPPSGGERATPRQPNQQPPERKPGGPPAEGRAVPRTPSAPENGQAVPRERPREGMRAGGPEGPFYWPPIYLGPFYPWGFPYGYPEPYPPYGYWYSLSSYGDLRLDIDRKEAAVYVDGYYAGVVDEFDGFLQRLTLTVGRHHLEVCAMGYETLTFDVNILAGRTITLRQSMVPIQP